MRFRVKKWALPNKGMREKMDFPAYGRPFVKIDYKEGY